MEIVEVMAEEGLYNAFFHESVKTNTQLSRTVAESIGTAYEHMLLKGEDVESIISLANRKTYNEKTWGPQYKRNEVNIVDNSADDDFQPLTLGISADKIMSQSTQTIEEEDVFEAADKLLDIEVNLRGMRALQDYFLIQERIDFRELLLNIFKEGDAHPEGVERLMNLMQEYAYKVKDTVTDYLYYRTHQLIPKEYEDTLF